MDAAKETTILLVRHGETVDNARQIMQGQTQGELNERGREQARQVAERLAADPVDVIIASDLRRADYRCPPPFTRSDYAAITRTRLGRLYRSLHP